MDEKRLRIALAGNPNTGKSTVFNALTGLKQHTGNWSGKTVGNAVGYFSLHDWQADLYDLPGIYSLFSESAEERAAKEFICYEAPDITVVVLDATSLERNLPLGLQIMELTKNVVFCLNLMDEAKKKGIAIDHEQLQKITGVPVISMAARSGVGLTELKRLLLGIAEGHRRIVPRGIDWSFTPDTEEGYHSEKFREERSLAFLERAEEICEKVVQKKETKDRFTEGLDKIMLSPKTGIPLMLLLLGAVFWITVAGANVPSDLLMRAMNHWGKVLRGGLVSLGTPLWLESLLMDGVYLTVSWVTAVMLPPMAIFFPLFTLLEDFGLLPRIAFNLDGLFQKAGAHGKQALTMSMGFGCNAAGVTACRIIESPRERLIAILTNNFVPCNGRFPTLILLAGFFFAKGDPLAAGIFVFLLIILAVAVTLMVSAFLSRTLLKGMPSAFVLELPPYRRPQIGQVIIRSVLDRTAYVLGRAATVAIPAGAVIWLCQNVTFGGYTLLYGLTVLLEPLGALMGLSGVILAAFLLGIPANEIVIPILLMVYSQSGMLVEAEGMAQAGAILTANGWTWVTAVCTILFSLNHFPCATTLLTIRKETGSWFWTGVSFLLPTVVGILLCILVNFLAHWGQLIF
ncbi:MAG: ferrous iron transport protein B [Anaerotignum sp.]|nr:ferrous iron transport protein B [Anaerotignum sp.]